jgi:hypothetical protein
MDEAAEVVAPGDFAHGRSLSGAKISVLPVIAISRSAHRILARHRLDAILGGIDYALAHDYPAREKA